MQIEQEDLVSLFDQELKLQNNDVRKEAALAALRRLSVGNDLTVEQFFGQVQLNPDLWAAVAQVGIIDLAEALNGTDEEVERAAPSTRRARVGEDAKAALKLAVFRVCSASRDGVSRTACASAILSQGLAPAGIQPEHLGELLRQPLRELVEEGRLRTTGKLKTLRYQVSSGAGERLEERSAAPTPNAE